MGTTNITLRSSNTETLSSARLALRAEDFRAMWSKRFGSAAPESVEVDIYNLSMSRFDDDARDAGVALASLRGDAYVLLVNAGARGRDVWALCTVGESH